MIRRFDEFDNHDRFSKRISLVGESHDLTDLYGDEESPVRIELEPNAYSTYQVFNRLSGSNFLPKTVGTKFGAYGLKAPITAVSPESQIRTFPTFRKLNSTPTQPGSVYFTKPKFMDQVQIAAYDGDIFGARQIVDGKPIHIDMSRFPGRNKLASLSKTLYEKLGETILRFRAGINGRGPVLLMMEDFRLNRPDLVNLYFKVHESKLGQLPDWYKHKIKSGLVGTYLNEYINREEVSKKCPYLL